LDLFSVPVSGQATSPITSGALIRFVEICALLCLVAIMTYFLVAESAKFYLQASERPTAAYLKAGMVEAIAIVFSFSGGGGSLLRWLQKLLVGLLCGLTLLTMSGPLVRSAVQEVIKVQSASRAIGALNIEITQKELLQKEYVNKGWLGAARRYEKGIDQVRRQLAIQRQSLTTLEVPGVTLNGLGILVAFRLLIVVANLIAVHRLANVIHFRNPSHRIDE
jgi:hypothetical protein